MRRIVLAIMGTLSGLVMLFSYHSSTNTTDLAAPATDGTTSDATPSSGSLSTATTAPADPSKTASSAAPSTSSSSSSSSAATSSTAGSSSAAAKSSTSSSTAKSSTATTTTKSSGTYTGAAASTRWGTVQVRITVSNGKITKAEAIQYPSENPRDQEINAYAVPQLNAEVVAKQSASIDGVSGATVTSGGYIQSLQSAIDQAHL